MLVYMVQLAHSICALCGVHSPGGQLGPPPIACLERIDLKNSKEEIEVCVANALTNIQKHCLMVPDLDLAGTYLASGLA